MAEILDITSPIVLEESITSYEVHAHQPYATSTFNNSDEIHITIQNQNQSVLPSKSSIHIQGKLTKPYGEKLVKSKFVNNGICHLFSEIRYELFTEVVGKCKNVGITTLMKGYVSLTPSTIVDLENAGWLQNEEIQDIVEDDQYRLSLLNYLNTDPEIAVGFRSWDLYEYPILPQSSKHIWTVKTSSQLGKTRLI